MTDPGREHPPGPPGTRPSPVVSVLLTIVGAILLLPGLCSLALIGDVLRGDTSGLIGIWLVCLAISFCGIVMIRGAWMRR